MNKPTSLEDLPQRLKSQQEIGNTDSILVDVGQIVFEPHTNNYQKIFFSTLIVLFTALGIGVASFDFRSNDVNQQYTVILNTDYPSQLTSDIDAEIIAVKQIADSTYEVKVSTKKNKSSLFDWLRDKSASNIR